MNKIEKQKTPKPHNNNNNKTKEKKKKKHKTHNTISQIKTQKQIKSTQKSDVGSPIQR